MNGKGLQLENGLKILKNTLVFYRILALKIRAFWSKHQQGFQPVSGWYRKPFTVQNLLCLICPAELHACCFPSCSPRTAHATRSEYVLDDSPTVKALRRQCHCAAYNLLAAVISCTQSKMEFYNVFLFKEDASKVSEAASDRRGGWHCYSIQ